MTSPFASSFPFEYCLCCGELLENICPISFHVLPFGAFGTIPASYWLGIPAQKATGSGCAVLRFLFFFIAADPDDPAGPAFGDPEMADMVPPTGHRCRRANVPSLFGGFAVLKSPFIEIFQIFASSPSPIRPFFLTPATRSTEPFPTETSFP